MTSQLSFSHRMTVLICNSGIINLKAQLIHCLYISWWPRTSICPGWPELSSYVCPGRSDFISLFSLGNVFKPTLGWENEYLLSNSKAVIVLSKQEWWNQKGKNKQTNNSKLGTWLQLQLSSHPKWDTQVSDLLPGFSVHLFVCCLL